MPSTRPDWSSARNTSRFRAPLPGTVLGAAALLALLAGCTGGRAVGELIVWFTRELPRGERSHGVTRRRRHPGRL